ncbi:MAG: hypothetical protein HOO93_08290 [Methyloglobulus sp.]|nr:hypothetical protein [Methyloglobulus sp.]
MRRNPPHGKGTPHIRRITPHPNKSGKSKSSENARLIRHFDDRRSWRITTRPEDKQNG